MSRQCSICGKELADSPLAGPAHARAHRNDFEDMCGRPPEDYHEVRALFVDGEVPDDVDIEPPGEGVSLAEIVWPDDYEGSDR